MSLNSCSENWDGLDRSPVVVLGLGSLSSIMSDLIRLLSGSGVGLEGIEVLVEVDVLTWGHALSNSGDGGKGENKGGEFHSTVSGCVESVDEKATEFMLFWTKLEYFSSTHF